MRTLLLFPLLLAFSLSSTAANIRLIIVADSLDYSIGEGIKNNTRKIRDLFRDMSRQTGYTLIENSLVEQDFSCSLIDQTINDLPTQDNDVIVFYYSGHGYRRAAEASIFPSFYCGENYFSPMSPSLKNVTDKLMAKNPKLLISIADTCNVVISPPVVIQRAPAAAEPLNKALAYRNLLENYRGVIMLSSSKPGQYSWYYPTGGLFTTQFLSSMNRNTEKLQSAQWENIIKDATVDISLTLPSGEGNPSVVIQQTPQFDTSDLVKQN